MVAMPRFQPSPDALRRVQASRSVDRRTFLRAAGLAGLGLGAPSLLSACGTPAAKQSASSCRSTDLSA